MLRHRTGFSLVELSIVLVLLGLLVGGILGGQALIQSSKLRSIHTEQQRFTAAAISFRDIYGGLPGDLRDAASYWGLADPVPTTCRVTTTTDTRTCNGNGNGIIGDYLPQGNENFAFWKHLANAGLIEGSYAGAGSPAALYLTPTPLNVPAARYGNSALWTAFHPSSGYITNAQYFQLDYGNFLALTKEMGANNQIGTPFITPAEAWSLDTKVDDGKPGMGKMIGRYTQCSMGGATNTDFMNAEYNVTNTNEQCSLFYPRLF